ncbi:hypothetical protein ACP70R_002888 [Stipagrostis hirtigluma subsp. patula]
METTTQDDLSSTANQSFFSDEGTASEESGWTSYIDYFMETQRRQKEASNDDSRPTSEYDGGHCGAEAGAIASSFAEEPRLPALVEPSSEASRRLKKLGRKKVDLCDESLEDTATSPISRPMLVELRDSDANHQRKNGACDEISHFKKSTTDDEFDCGSHINNGANTSADIVNVDDSNELRKKGLCLVPVSVFHV